MSTTTTPEEELKTILKERMKKTSAANEREWLRKKMKMSDDDLCLMTHLERTTWNCITVTIGEGDTTTGRPSDEARDTKRLNALAKAKQFVRDNGGKWPSQNQVAAAADIHWKTLLVYMDAYDLSGPAAGHARYLKARRAESQAAVNAPSKADPLKRAKGGDSLDYLAAPATYDPAASAEAKDELQRLIEEQNQDAASDDRFARQARRRCG